MSLEDALKDFTDYGGDVLGSGHETFQNYLRRFVNLLDPSQPLGQIASALLPDVEFWTWYNRCLQAGGSISGSGTLDWPESRRERVAFQLELLRNIASEKIPVYDFCHRFANGGPYLDNHIHKFNEQVFQPFVRDFLRSLQSARRTTTEHPVTSESSFPVPNLVDADRLEALRQLRPKAYDLARLVRLCEELNICYGAGAYHGAILITRALLDHVPPLFNVRTFGDIANNYRGGRSFREAMVHLQNGARKIADLHLHTQVRSSEALPNQTQVNFSPYLDVLLAEIIRIQEKGPTDPIGRR